MFTHSYRFDRLIYMFFFSIYIFFSLALVKHQEAEAADNDYFQIVNKYYNEYLYVKSRFHGNYRRKVFTGKLPSVDDASDILDSSVWRLRKNLLHSTDQMPVYTIKNMNKAEYLYSSKVSHDPNRAFAYLWRGDWFQDWGKNRTEHLWYILPQQDGSYLIQSYHTQHYLTTSYLKQVEEDRFVFLWQGAPDIWEDNDATKRNWFFHESRYPLNSLNL